MEECKHCGGKLICYATRVEGDHRVRYMRCKECSKPAAKKQIPEPVPSALMQRIARLEDRIEKLEAAAKAAIEKAMR